MSELSTQYHQEHAALKYFAAFAQREPVTYAPTNDALAHVARRIFNIATPTLECIARMRPELASCEWGIDDDHYEISGEAAYATWRNPTDLPENLRSNRLLYIRGADESANMTASMDAPEKEKGMRDLYIETALTTGKAKRDIGISLSEKDLITDTWIERGKHSPQRIKIDVPNDELLQVWEVKTEEFADPEAAKIFIASGVYGLTHYHLWRCARDLCGIVEMNDLLRQIPDTQADNR